MSKREIIQVGRLVNEGKDKHVTLLRNCGYSIEMTAKMLNVTPDVVRFMERRRE